MLTRTFRPAFDTLSLRLAPSTTAVLTPVLQPVESEILQEEASGDVIVVNYNISEVDPMMPSNPAEPTVPLVDPMMP